MKKAKPILIILVCFLVMIGLMYLSYIAVKIPPNPAGTVGNTGGNLYNNGLFCEHDGKVYFSNPYDDNTMYVMDPDETDVEKLTTIGASSINAAGKYLYYYQENTGSVSGLGNAMQTTGMYRMKKNGKNRECLKLGSILTLNVIDSTVYYQHFNRDLGLVLDSIAIDETAEDTAIASVVTPASAADSILYYAQPDDNYYLYCYDTRTGASSLFWQHKVYNPIYHTDQYIYFIDVENHYELHRYNPRTGENETLTRDPVDKYNVYGDMIYYQKSSQTEPALKRMQTDGSNPEIVSEGVYTNINITSSYVYYTRYDTTYPVYHQTLYGEIQPSVFMPLTEE